MSEQHEIPIHLRTQTGQSREGVWRFTQYDTRDRMLQAWKMLGLFWALAAVSVLIPIAHWLLVPLFFIIGPIAAILRYRVTETADTAAGTCPTCQQAVELDLENKDQLPKWTYCPNCDAAVELHARSSAE